jgi:putative ABC transport system permease protein
VRKTLKIIVIAIRSLLQHKLRAILSILGVICGVMAVLAMVSIGEGAKQESLSQIEQLGTRNIYLKGISLTETQERTARERLSQGLTVHDKYRIMKGCPGVKDVACLKELTASIIGMIRNMSPQIVACSPNYVQVQKLFLSQGRFINEIDIAHRNLVCVLGDTVAESLGPGGKPGGHIRIEEHIFTVVGVLRRYQKKAAKSSAVSIRNYNDMVFVPLGTEGVLDQARDFASLPKRKLNEIVIQARRTDQVLKTAILIKRIMDISHGGVKDYQMVIPLELLQQSQKTQRTFNIVLGSIAFISLLVGGIGIMNIMLATVSERTREIGLRRAVGAAQGDIIIQFLIESVILTFSGGLFGIAIGIGGVWLITALAGWKTAITLWSLILPLGMSLFVGIFFGLYPAYQAAKMDPISALHHE